MEKTNVKNDYSLSKPIEELKEGAIWQINAYQNAHKYYDHERLVQHVYDQFTNGTEKYHDKRDRENIYEFTMFCQELLVLLANPKISSKLPEYFHKKAGNMLFNMMRFFEIIEDDPICNVEYDLFEINHNNLSKERLASLITKYNKKLIEKAY